MSRLSQPLGGHPKDNFIQVWRGIAALLVIYFHLSSRVPPSSLGMSEGPSLIFYSGKIGVLIFFIISGYLIVQSLQFSKNLASFYAKRISRIWPLFVLASVLIFLFLQLIDPPVVLTGPKKFYTHDPSVVDLAGSLFFLEDLGFHWVDGVFWSILVELKFYMWIGLLAAISQKDFIRHFALAALLMSGLEMLISFSHIPELRPAQLALNGVFIAQYLPFFAIGALLVGKRDRGLLAAVIVLALARAGFETFGDPNFDALRTGQFLVVLAIVVAGDAMLLRSRIFLTLGDYSYSWYLFHQMIGLSLIKAFSSAMGYDEALVAVLCITFAIAVAASWAAEWRFRDQVYRALLALFTQIGLKRLSLGGSARQEAHAR